MKKMGLAIKLFLTPIKLIGIVILLITSIITIIMLKSKEVIKFTEKTIYKIIALGEYNEDLQ